MSMAFLNHHHHPTRFLLRDVKYVCSSSMILVALVPAYLTHLGSWPISHEDFLCRPLPTPTSSYSLYQGHQSQWRLDFRWFHRHHSRWQLFRWVASGLRDDACVERGESSPLAVRCAHRINKFSPGAKINVGGISVDNATRHQGSNTTEAYPWSSGSHLELQV